MNNIVFTFNIRQSVFKNLGINPFQHINSLYGFHLLPIVTQLTDSIDNRAKQISNALPEYLDKVGLEKAHIVSYSLSGLDMRYALHQHNLSGYCKTLTTISTPHQ